MIEELFADDIDGARKVIELKPRKQQYRHRVVAFDSDDSVLGCVEITAFGYRQARSQGAKLLKWNLGVTGVRYGCFKSGTKKFKEHEPMKEAA